MARHRAQSPREALPAAAPGTGPAQTRNAPVGSAGVGDCENPRRRAGRSRMTRLRAFTRGLRGLFRSKRVARELAEDLTSYPECSIAEKVRSGMAHENARRHARVELGSIEAVKDHTRDVGWEAPVGQLWVAGGG